MLDPAITNLILVGGAAGAFFVVLWWLIGGKLHTDSEVQGLKQDKADLLAINKAQAEALKDSNAALAKASARDRRGSDQT